MNNNAPNKDPNRLLRSFGRRKGRALSDYQQSLVEQKLPKLLPPKLLRCNAIKPQWLEIGFGAGEHLHHQALGFPETTFIGAEPYLNGIAKLLMALEKKPVNDNLRIIPDDVRDWLASQEAAVLDGVYLLFPDPWPKTSHNKRRILNHKLLDMIAHTLKPDGLLRIATDHVDYSVWMFEHLLQRADFTWTAKNVDDWHEPFSSWQETRYQQKTSKQGRLPVFLEFRKTGQATS